MDFTKHRILLEFTKNKLPTYIYLDCYMEKIIKRIIRNSPGNYLLSSDDINHFLPSTVRSVIARTKKNTQP